MVGGAVNQHRLGTPDNPVSTPAGLVHTIEQLSTLEACLWSILEGMKSNVTYVAYFCREYWGTSASRAQLSLERLDWNDRLKRQVQQACVLESLSMAVASHLASGTMQEVSVTIRSRLRNLLYYVHENCLVLLDLMRQRWIFETQQHQCADVEKPGHCPENLDFDILVRVNRYRPLRKGEHVMALRQHNEMIANVVRQLCRGGTSKQLLPRGRGGGMGDRSPGAPVSSRGARGPAAGVHANVLAAVNDVLAASMPLERMRARTVRSNMLQNMRFLPLLNVDGNDPDCPWPVQDPYDRFGVDKFSTDAPVIWFEPLPPMMADLDRVPKLPPVQNSNLYTLVLDLDETLVHFFEQNGTGTFGIRPGMHEFLQRMSSAGYELVIFTASTQDYADWVIDQIDVDGLIHHRLYRQHALPWGPLFAKDLSGLGRDLDRTLIIDNVQENFMLQPNHGIFIMTWYDDPEDTALFDLVPLLEELITTRARVPDILDKYQEQIPAWAGFGKYLELGDVSLEVDQNFTSSQPPADAGPAMHMSAPSTTSLSSESQQHLAHSRLPEYPNGETELGPPREPPHEHLIQHSVGVPVLQQGPQPQTTTSTSWTQGASSHAPAISQAAYPDWTHVAAAPQVATQAQFQRRFPHPKDVQVAQVGFSSPAFSVGAIAGPLQSGPCQVAPVQRTQQAQQRPAYSVTSVAGPYQAQMLPPRQ